MAPRSASSAAAAAPVIDEHAAPGATSGSLRFTPLTAQPATLAPAERRKPRSLLMEWALAGTATMSACLFTNPMEVVKTRLQVQNELGRAAAAVYAGGASGAAAAASSAAAGPPPPKVYKNVLHAFYVVARTEGLRGLQGGLGPSLLYQLTMNGTRLGAYEPLKRLVTRLAEGDLDGTKGSDRGPKLGDHARAHRPPVFWHNVLAAWGSGMCAAFIGSPFFLVKVRLQIQSKAAIASTVQAAPGAAAAAAAAPAAVGAQHAYTSAFSGLRSIYAADGLSGLWRGATASMLRVSVGSVVQLSSYDHCKFLIMQRTGWADSVKVHVSASLLSGLLVTLAMNPPDVISTRMYNQPVRDGKGLLYTGLVDCFRKTVKTEGIQGLYKGVTAHYLRLGPHTLLTFLFWEQIKAAAERAGI